MKLQSINKDRIVCLRDIVTDAVQWCQAMGIPQISYRQSCLLVAALVEEEFREYLDAEESNTLAQLDAIIDSIWVASNYLAFNGIAVPDKFPQVPKSLATRKFYLRAYLIQAYKITAVLPRTIAYVSKLGDLLLAFKPHGLVSNWAECVRAANYGKLWTADQTRAANTADGPLPMFTPSPTVPGMFVGRRSDGKIIKPPGFKSAEQLYKENYTE